VLFPEPAFLFLLLPLLLGTIVVVPPKGRNVALLLASLIFYWWGERLFMLMVISITMNYLFGLFIDKERRPTRSRVFLILGIAANLGLLGVYKYGNFAIGIWNDLGLPEYHRDDPIHLPIGISFFTFQAMSYIVDCYRGDARRQRNPLHVGLYVSLFPQLIAGPIVRYRDVAEQIVHRVISFPGFSAGLQRFIVGLGKKVLVANSLGATVDLIFDLPADQLSPAVAWCGITCYILQLYFDFSGYSDMAIGLGRMLGFRFPENFNSPYISRSITEMWQRWHITLGSWFRDYLYIPLGGNRCAPWRVYFNLGTVFVLCGLWHGASWNFIIWGAWNGAFLIAERSGLGGLLRKLPAAVPWAYTTLGWMLGLVIFKAGDPKIGGDMGQAGAYLAHLFGFGPGGAQTVGLGAVVNAEMAIGLALGLIGSFPLIPWLRRRYEGFRYDARNPERIDAVWHGGRAVCLAVILLLSAYLVAAGAYSPFLYLQF